jgi:hypothetical protein
MIEDALLEDLIRQAGEALAVPTDGPERILAVRDATAPRRERRQQGEPRAERRAPAGWIRRRPVLAGAAALMLIAGAVPVATSFERTGTSKAADAARGAASPSQLRSSAHTNLSGAGVAASGSKAVFTPTAAPLLQINGTSEAAAATNDAVPALPSKVIKTGAVTLQVGQCKLGDTMGRMADLATSLGGFVASSSSDTIDTGSAPYGDITLRVPVASFESLLEQVQALGTPTSVTSSGQDVTSQYVDLQARIQSLADTRSQFQQILTKAESIGDILAVEQQIGDIQTQIEQLQGELEVMTDQTSYSTLSVHVFERGKQVAAPTPRPAPSGVSKAWSHARHSFARGIEAVIAASGGAAVFLVFLGLVVGLARFGWILVRRRLV